MSDTDVEITEQNTAPERTPADEEVGESTVNFTTAAGTPEEPASSSDGTEAPSTDSTTSPSSDTTLPDATGDSAPLALGATEASFDAPAASKSDTGSADAPSTDEDDDQKAVMKSALESLRGEHADGEGFTHVGTDTPEKLISNPVDAVTGQPLFPEDSRSEDPLSFNSFSDEGEDEDASGKLGEAIELVSQVRDSL